MRERGDQYTASRFRSIERAKFTPQVCGAEPYRSVRSGMRNSAVQPLSVTFVFTSHDPSQLVFTPAPAPVLLPPVLPVGGPPRIVSPSLRTCASYWRPTGVVPNR